MNKLGTRIAALASITLLGTCLVPASVSEAAITPENPEVEALQMPAWVTRAGKRAPLALGARIKNGDTITTGAGSRVLLRMPEGSAVKLGENARFDLNDAQRGDRGQPSYRASLGIRQGAFRFTTAPEDKAHALRDIKIELATVTASIVGTDIWGKSGIDRDIVALIEGKVEVSRKGDAPTTLDEPNSVFVAPTDAKPTSTIKITLAQLNAFAQETEIRPGSGASGKGGSWKVYASRSARSEDAAAALDRLSDAGYAASIERAVSQGKQVYQVRIAGVLSEADGVAIAVKLRVELGLQDVRVSL